MRPPLFLLVLVLLSCQQQRTNENLIAKKNPDSPRMRLINGDWFNGEKFENRNVWTANGLLYFDKIDQSVDTVIDLKGKYVIPPFAEAHNHNLESDYELDLRIDNYLKNGVFYVKHLSAIKMQLAPLMGLYNKPKGLDLSTTYAPLTGTGGHPIAIREKFYDWGYYDVFTSKQDIETHGYFKIDSEKDLDKNWSHILSFEPEFIKVNLLYSEQYEKRKNDTTYFGKKGMNPRLIEKVVLKAHNNGLRVSAHVETAYDFHVAVEAGVDEIAHLPEIKNGQPIDIADIRTAKEKNITTVTTISLVKKRAKLPNYESLVNNIKQNLLLFKQEGATLALGSDNFNGNSVGEFAFINELSVFSNLELLKMWTENATKTTFPDRKVGFLKNGYEASFLVLNKNPLEDMSMITESIETRIKQGSILD